MSRKKPQESPAVATAPAKQQSSVVLRTVQQKIAWRLFSKADVLFLIGPAGVGKSFISMALAIRQIEAERAKRVILTRPIVESEESLGYLPGDMKEKTDPYMSPLYDQVVRIKDKEARDFMRSHIEISPLAYMRGRTFTDCVAIFDEAQNATTKQLKLYLSRLGENAKIIITGDPGQSDIQNSGLLEVVDRVKDVPGIAVVKFEAVDIVRHPIVEQILNRLP